MEKRTYYGPDIDIAALAQALKEWLEREQYQTQVVADPNGGAMVQARKESTLRTVAGMAYALTIRMNFEGEYLAVDMGGAKWAEKGVVGAVGLLIFVPALITAGVGAFQQSQLQNQAWQFVEGFVRTNSAYGGSMMGGGPPQGMFPSQFPGTSHGAQPCRPPAAAPGSPPPPVNLGQAAGSAAPSLSCPQCSQPIAPGARFCAGCGNPAPSYSSACPGCGQAAPPGSRFCSSCGTPLG